MSDSAAKTDVTPSSAFGAALSSVLKHNHDQIQESFVNKKLALRHAKERKELRANRRERKLKKELRLKEHVGDIDITTDAALERYLLKTATKGVVTLFNAVKAHQKISHGAEATTKKQANDIKKMSKTAFLEMLHSGGARTAVAEKTSAQEPQKKWSALNADSISDEAQAEPWSRTVLSESDVDIAQIEECHDYEEECDEWE